MLQDYLKAGYPILLVRTHEWSGRMSRSGSSAGRSQRSMAGCLFNGTLFGATGFRSRN
jgi:hypothetical protein